MFLLEARSNGRKSLPTMRWGDLKGYCGLGRRRGRVANLLGN